MIKVKDTKRLKAFGFENHDNLFYSKTLIETEPDYRGIFHDVIAFVQNDGEVTLDHTCWFDKEKLEIDKLDYVELLIPLDVFFDLQAANILVKVDD